MQLNVTFHFQGTLDFDCHVRLVRLRQFWYDRLPDRRIDVVCATPCSFYQQKRAEGDDRW